MRRGFSTLEMMIAMAIMVITLSGVVVVSFGNQGMLIGGQTNAEAMNLAQDILEQQQQLARKDFRLVQATSSTHDIYTKTITVAPWENDPYTSKKVTATVSWQDQRMITRDVVVTTVLSNFMNAVGGDTCASPYGDWSAPLKNDYQMTAGDLLPGSMSGAYALGGLDAYRGKLYAAVITASASNIPTFFAFDTTNPMVKPVYLGSIDNNTNSITGLNAVVAGNTAIVSGTPHTYAYGANGFSANFSGTCTGAQNCSQLQVFDVTNPSAPTIAFNFKFATSTYSSPNWTPYVNGAGGQAVGKSIFYKDGYVYLGLTKTSSGPEFNIIDVHNPLNPTPISGYNVGAGVEAIYIRGKYAYLATDDSTKEIVVLDISNPLTPTLVSGVYNPPGIGYGNALYAVGDTLYFGKTMAGGQPELYALNIKNPGSGVALSGSKIIGASISGLIARGNLAFVLTSTAQQLNVFNISDPANITAHASPIALPGQGSVLDCEQNYMYVGSNNGASGYVSIVKPS